VAGCCDHDNEPSGFIKGGEFLDCLSVLLTYEEGLWSLDLIRQSLSADLIRIPPRTQVTRVIA
jgi:hypothetical protein